MQEVFEKIIEQLEEERELSHDDFDRYVHEVGTCLDVEYDDIFHRGIERAIKIVKQESAEYNNGWIPCSERLPEKKGKYLTTSKIYFVPDHVDEPDNYIGLEITYYSEINGWNGEVIAWQPLPAPYQPKGE